MSYIATKEQERAALEKIRKIVEGIGGVDSYIGTALKGVLEDAEENIDNDFGCSQFDRAEHAEDRAREAIEQRDEALDRALTAERQAAAAEQLVIELKAKLYDYMSK